MKTIYIFQRSTQFLTCHKERPTKAQPVQLVTVFVSEQFRFPEWDESVIALQKKTRKTYISGQEKLLARGTIGGFILETVSL